jgi:hypothetical protein
MVAMIENIDPLKILKQDEDFRKFFNDSIAEVLGQNSDFVKVIYSFYSIGMTQEQVGEWVKVNNLLGGKK